MKHTLSPRHRSIVRVPAVLADRGGAVAIEFAFIMVALILLLFGIVEFGRYLWAMEAVQEAATAGARCMALTQGVSSASGSCSSAAAYSSASTVGFIQSRAATWGVALSSANITATPSGNCGVSNMSQVIVTYNFKTILPAFIPIPAASVVTGSACFPNNG